MKLGDRLQALVDFVPEGSKVADVGTDHAYLALELMQSGRADFVVASDKNSGPLEAAHRSIREQGWDDKISIRQGDGLAVLEPGEVDIVCIAGMGGLLMTEILTAEPAVVKKLKRLVLQPMNGAAELRRWLYRHAWHIADESLAVDDGRIYEIICAEKGREKMPDALTLLLGPKLWEKKSPLLRYHIEQLLFQTRRIKGDMEKSPRARKTKKYQELEKQIVELEERLRHSASPAKSDASMGGKTYAD